MSGWLKALMRCLGIALLLAALCAGAAARAEEPESGAAGVAAAATDSLRYYNAGQLDAVVARLVPVLRDRTIDRRDRFSAAYLLSRLIERSGRSELLATLNDILIAMDQEGGERFGPNAPLIAHNVAQYYLSAGQFEEAYKASSPWLGPMSPLAEDPDMAGLYLVLLADTAKALAALRRWEDAAFVLQRGMASLAMNGRASPADVFAFFEAVGVQRMTAGLAHDARQVFAGLHRVAERTLPPNSPDRIRIALWLGSVLADTGETARSTEMLNGVVGAGRANPSLPRHWLDLAALTIAFNQVGQGALDDAERSLAALAETDVSLYRTLAGMLGAEIELLRGGRPASQDPRPVPPRDAASPAIGPAPAAYADYLAALTEAQAGRPTEAVRRIDNMLAKLEEQDVEHADAGTTHIVPPTAVERRMLERSVRMILGADAGAAKLDAERARLAFEIVQRLGRQRAALGGGGGASFRTMDMSALDREQLRARELLNHRRRALIDDFAARIGDREHGRPVMDLSEEDRWRGIAELALYHDKLREIRASLDSRMPGYLAATRSAHVGLDEFQAALTGDEAAVFLVPHGDGVLSACVGRGGMWLARGTTPRAETVAAIERLRQDLTAAPAPGSDDHSHYDMATAHSLYRTLFGGLEPCFETATHVIQVPTGDLLLLPTAALTTAPHEGPLSEAPWFVRSHAISLLPSAQSLTQLRARPASQAREAFLGFGDPALDATDKPRRVLDMTMLYAMRGRADPAEPRALGRLPDTAEELRALGRLLGAPTDRIKLGADATERTLRRETLSDFRILAFATHGLLAREIDGLSEPAIVLSSDRQETRLDDGLLTATDIAELRLDADLVILSACNTTGSDGRGDARGLTGLANAFFGAGARSLIANQWPVDWPATRDMMVEAVTGAVGPASSGVAYSLREGALKMIGARDRPDLAHPRFWAPFIVAGDGRALAGKPRAEAPRGVRLVQEWEIVEGGPQFDEAMRLEVASDSALLVTGVEGLSTESRRAGTFHWRVSPEGRILSRRTVGDLGFAASSIRLPGGDSIRMGTTHTAASMTDAVVYREAPDGTRRWSVIEQSPLHETPGELVRTPPGTILAIMTRNTVAEAEAGSQAVVLLELDEDGTLLRRQEIALPLCTVSDRDCTHRQATPLGYEPTASFLAGAFYGGDERLRLVLRVEGRQPPKADGGHDIDPISGHQPRCGPAVRTAIWELEGDLGAVRNATVHENLWPNAMATSPGGTVWLAGARYAPCEDDGDVFAAPVADSGSLGGAIADGTALDEAATSVALSPRNEVLIAGRANLPLQVAQRAADAAASRDHPAAERAESVGGEGAALLLLYDGRARLAASLAVPNRGLVRIRDMRFIGDDRFALVGTIDGGQVWIAAYRIERPGAP